MLVTLIYQDNQSNKFWRIEVNGTSYIITFGKKGTQGRMTLKEFDTEEACLKEAQKLLQSKKKKGYSEIASDDVIKESELTEDAFWTLLEKAKLKGRDLGEQMEWLTEHLARKSVKDILQFEYHFRTIYQSSYTSDLWAAAYIVLGGCSDDLFDYFRAWLLYLGKEWYERCIQDPESLLPIFEQLEEQDEMPDLEELLDIASTAFEAKTDGDLDDFFNMYEKCFDNYLWNTEIEFDWEEEDGSLEKKFPKLWARFGENPLEY